MRPTPKPAGLETPALHSRVVKGLFWVFALRMTDRALGFLRILVLARVLSPTDFGLFGVAVLALTALETVSQTGVNSALIQMKGDIQPYLNAAWTVQAARGTLLAGAFFLLAPSVAGFFSEPGVTPFLRALGLAVLFQGFTNVAVVYFQKDLEFRRNYTYLLSGSLVDLTVAVTAALLLKSAWALVLGLIAGSFVRMVASYLVHPYRPRPRFDLAKAQSLYAYGFWIWAIGVVSFLGVNADKALVGKALGAAALGYYVLAARVADLVVMDLGRVVGGVAFPAFSKVQDEPWRLHEGLLTTIEMLFFVSLPLTLAIVALGPELVTLIFGEKWIPMVGALAFLTLAGLGRALFIQWGALAKAVGRPGVELGMMLLRVITFAVAALYLLGPWGLTGVAAAEALGALVAVPALGFALHRLGALEARGVASRLAPSALGGAAMAAALAWVRALPLARDELVVAAGLALGGAAYLLPPWVQWRRGRGGPLARVAELLRILGSEAVRVRWRERAIRRLQS